MGGDGDDGENSLLEVMMTTTERHWDGADRLQWRVELDDNELGGEKDYRKSNRLNQSSYEGEWAFRSFDEREIRKTTEERGYYG